MKNYFQVQDSSWFQRRRQQGNTTNLYSGQAYRKWRPRLLPRMRSSPHHTLDYIDGHGTGDLNHMSQNRSTKYSKGTNHIDLKGGN